MVLSSKTLLLMGAFYTFAFKAHCTPFSWNFKSKKMSITKSISSYVLWVLCSTLMWTKIIFMTVRLCQSYKYLDVTVDQLCIHYYYWVLYSYAGFLQLNAFDMRKWFPLMVNRFNSFNSTSKRKYFPQITTPGILPRDDIEAAVINVFCIIFVNASVTFYLFLDDPKSPQFFYSILEPQLAVSGESTGESRFKLIIFAMIEGYLTVFSWTTIMLWASTSICCSNTLNFWVKQLNDRYQILHLSLPGSKMQEFHEKLKMYRKLQMLTTEYNSVCFRMTVGVKVAAFLSHLGTNYGTIRLFNSMKFQIWINCPLVSVCGLATILQLFKLLAWVNVEANDVLSVFKRRLLNVPTTGRFKQAYAERLLKSLRPLKVKGHHFYYFKQSTPVTFHKQLTDYTINILLTF